jgi:AcrR family transcriptional regulator
MSTAEPTARGGRPREADRTPTILAANTELLRNVGYDNLRIQDVADAAGVGLATIYRRWETKQALVIEAIERTDCLADLPATDDPRADLRALMRRHAHDLAGKAQMLPGLLCSIRAEPEVAIAVRDNIFDVMHARIRSLVAAVIGADDPDLEARAQLGPAILHYRALVLQDLDDPDAAADAVTELMLRPTAR